MNVETGSQERKTGPIFLGVALGIAGVLIVAGAAVAWYFSLGLLLLGVGSFFLMMGIRSGLKYRNPALANALTAAFLILEGLLILWFVKVFIAAS
ncbi:MAG: hypothetical protein RRA35_06340 [Desulfomonilia bacterium]|nr:hypothetical protein [Anaerolineales bacterium]MDT8272793.1 hypothetical protein [Desulfomonilia bacterium]